MALPSTLFIMIQAISASFDGGGAKMGASLGPKAIQLAGLARTLQDLSNPLRKWHWIPSGSSMDEGQGLPYFNEFLEFSIQLKAVTRQILNEGDLPLVLGGVHSISMATISAALEHFSGKVATLWIDAHADLNSAESSVSKHLHGMPLGLLSHGSGGSDSLISSQWNQLQQALCPKATLPVNQMAWFALRDVDVAERGQIRIHPECLPITMAEIDREGLISQLERVHAWLVAREIEWVWVSFDVDALDPILAPGTGTAVRGGLSYREAHLMAEWLYCQFFEAKGSYKLAGLEVVETNPLEDTGNSTAKMAVEWIASFFGKSILGDATETSGNFGDKS